MGCYFTLCHNTYGYSLLFYKVYINRENAGSWNSGLEKEQILETYSAQLQKSWNSTEYLKINKEKSSPKMKARGPTPCSRGWGARPSPLGAPPYLVAASLLPWHPLQVSWITFVPKITLPKVSFRLDSVWYSFSAKHWNRQKTTICTGPWVSRLVPKIIWKCINKHINIQNR